MQHSGCLVPRPASWNWMPWNATHCVWMQSYCWSDSGFWRDWNRNRRSWSGMRQQIGISVLPVEELPFEEGSESYPGLINDFCRVELVSLLCCPMNGCSSSSKFFNTSESSASINWKKQLAKVLNKEGSNQVCTDSDKTVNVLSSPVLWIRRKRTTTGNRERYTTLITSPMNAVSFLIDKMASVS